MKLPVFTRYVRRIHMYLALFLVPWILMYTLSSLVFNHFGTIRNWYGGNLNKYEQVDEIEYPDAFPSGTTPEEAAKQILLDLNMDGSHFVRGNLKGEQFTIMRQSTYQMKRVIYYPNEGRVTVEEQVANLPNMLTRMHVRHGFEQNYTSMKIWGLGVEITALAMLFWIASGTWLWWTIKPARMWGAVCVLGGLSLFAVLLFSI
ncbi:MAG: hypothetical protein O7C75_08610 [Verrucomicrobia bacterium]|nr:hypothetical protein [Verrucomicrobiota bacterium]